MLQEDAAGGDCDGSQKELHRNFCDFCHGMSVLMVFDEIEQPVNPLIECFTDDQADIQTFADHGPAALDESVRGLRSKESF